MSKKKNNSIAFGIFLIVLCLLLSLLVWVVRGEEEEFYSNCKITQGTIEKTESRSVRISYEIDGKQYSNVLLWGQIHNIDVGSNIEICYNPNNYNEIGVYREEYAIIDDIMAVVLFAILFIVGILYIVFNVKKK